jgi:F0F1-type ATP synthase assembly protein I
MPEKDTAQEKSDKENWQELGWRWIGVGIEFVVVVGIFSYGGYWLDKSGDTDTSPGFMIMGFFVGFAVMLYTMIKRAGGIKW